MKKDFSDFKVLLYQFHNFYIEVYYHPLNNKVVSIKSFSALEKLDPYLEDIELPNFI